MKLYTTPVLRVKLDIPVSHVASIKFLFKQEQDPNAKTLLLKEYPGEVTYERGCFNVPVTQAETALFAPDENFYMDTLVTDQAGHVPRTDICKLFMHGSMFSYEEAVT